MELHTCGLPGNESPGRITVNVDLAELDKLLDEFPTHGPIIETAGFTVYDIMERRDIGRARASTIIGQLLKEGKIQLIGRRNGRNGMKVFDIIK